MTVRSLTQLVGVLAEISSIAFSQELGVGTHLSQEVEIFKLGSQGSRFRGRAIKLNCIV